MKAGLNTLTVPARQEEIPQPVLQPDTEHPATLAEGADDELMARYL